jgi:hypothetical protein
VSFISPTQIVVNKAILSKIVDNYVNNVYKGHK